MSIRAARSALLVVIELLWGFAAAAVFVSVFAGGQQGPSMVAVAIGVLASTAIGYTIMGGDGRGERMPALAALASVIAIVVIAQFEYASRPWSLGWAGDLVTHGSAVSDRERGIAAGVVALALLWVRGAGAAIRAQAMEPPVLGIVGGLAAVAVAAAAQPDVRGPDLFGPIAIAYVPLALIALALFTVADAEQPVAGIVAGSGRWLAAIVAGTLVVGALAAAFDPGSLGVLAPVGRPVGFVLERVLTVVLAPFALLASLLGHLPGLPNHPPTTPQVQGTPQIKPPHETPEWQIILGRVIAGAVLAALVGAVCGVIWLMFRRKASRPRPLEFRETIEVEEGADDRGGDLLGGLLRRFRRPRPPEGAAVRRLYHEMLADAADRGVERPAGTTPARFAPRLDAHYGSGAPSAISDAFGRSRYGAAAFDDATVAAMRKRWLDARAARGL